MQLGTMETRPKEAGIARIQFGCKERGRTLPFRHGNRIVLPYYPQAEFFPLKDGRQFLFTCPDPTSSKKTPKGKHLYFGGTDETCAFLTRLFPGEPLAAFKRGGEEGLFDSLKPKLIKNLERTLGVAAQRQGDLFVVKLPYSWEQVSIFSLLAEEGRTAPKSVKAYPIGRTQHKLTGRYIEGLTAYFVEGTIDRSPSRTFNAQRGPRARTSRISLQSSGDRLTSRIANHRALLSMYFKQKASHSHNVRHFLLPFSYYDHYEPRPRRSVIPTRAVLVGKLGYLPDSFKINEDGFYGD